MNKSYETVVKFVAGSRDGMTVARSVVTAGVKEGPFAFGFLTYIEGTVAIRIFSSVAQTRWGWQVEIVSCPGNKLLWRDPVYSFAQGCS